MQSGDSLRIKVTADIIVGETDTGGISLDFSSELEVTNILCSYKDNVNGMYGCTFNNLSMDGKYKTRVIIARHINSPPSGGGQGVLLVEAQLSGHTALSEIDSPNFIVSVGGKPPVAGMVSEKVTIPLLHNIAP